MGGVTEPLNMFARKIIQIVRTPINPDSSDNEWNNKKAACELVLLTNPMNDTPPEELVPLIRAIRHEAIEPTNLWSQASQFLVDYGMRNQFRRLLKV